MGIGAHLGYAFSAHGLTGNLGWAAAPVFLAGLAALWAGGAYVAAAGMFALILVVDLVPGASGRMWWCAMRRPPRWGNLDLCVLPVVWWCLGFLLSTMTLAVVQNFGFHPGGFARRAVRDRYLR